MTRVRPSIHPVRGVVAFIAVFVSLLILMFRVRLGSYLLMRGTGLPGVVAMSIVLDTPPSPG